MSDKAKPKVDAYLAWNENTSLWEAQVLFHEGGTYAANGKTAPEALERVTDLLSRIPFVLDVNKGTQPPDAQTERATIAVPSTSAVEAAAQRTLDLMPEPKPGNPPGDVILTVTVIMLIVKLVIVAYNCWKDHHKTVSIVYEPNWIQRLYLRRVVKKVLAEHGQLGKLDDVMAALLQMAKASTPEDIQAIFDEARSDPAIWTTAAQLKLV